MRRRKEEVRSERKNKSSENAGDFQLPSDTESPHLKKTLKSNLTTALQRLKGKGRLGETSQERVYSIFAYLLQHCSRERGKKI